jgi:hypothetical protein
LFSGLFSGFVSGLLLGGNVEVACDVVAGSAPDVVEASYLLLCAALCSRYPVAP